MEADGDSDMDSGVGDEAGEDAGSGAESPVVDEERVLEKDDAEEHGGQGGEFTVFVAFKGNMEDEDFSKKLEAVLSGIPNVLDMGEFNFNQRVTCVYFFCFCNFNALCIHSL